jgi:flagellar assembly protein FliH
MVDAVKMDFKEQSGQLAESEVARLLTVLQNAEFKRSETRNIIKDQSFKPRSLMEIAIEAQQRDVEIEAVKQAEESLAAAQRAEGASASKAKVDENQNFDELDTVDLISTNPNLDNQDPATGKNDGALMPADDNKNARLKNESPDNSPSPIIDAALIVSPDIGSGDQSSDASSKPANDALANNAAEHDPIADSGAGDAAQAAEIAANFETTTAAFERGKAEGVIAGRDAGIAQTKAAAEAAAQANLADKIAAFDAALMALAKPQALQAADLSRSIHAAILRLASQRAGQQIDEMPENFLARIEALVTSIGQKTTAGKVHINDDDYKVMLPYLAATHYDFVAESSLARGDVILKFAGVELHDIAETRLGGQYAETSNSMAEAPTEAAGLDLEIISTESVPSEPVPVETMPVETMPVETMPFETMPVETMPVETMPVETMPVESAPKIRPMTTVRPLETNNDTTDNPKDDQPHSPSDETSS